MAKNKISEFSSTPANNTDIAGINIAEGCAPSGINNAIRELMAQLKDQQAGTDGDSFTVGGVLTVNGNTVLGTTTTNTVTLNAATVVAPTELTISSTGAVKLPSGTTAQRPSGTAGQIRYNSTLTRYEGYANSEWNPLGAGATGGGSDTVFVENSQIVTTSYTITTGKNAMSTGDITINGGVTITVPTGARWVVL